MFRRSYLNQTIIFISLRIWRCWVTLDDAPSRAVVLHVQCKFSIFVFRMTPSWPQVWRCPGEKEQKQTLTSAIHTLSRRQHEKKGRTFVATATAEHTQGWPGRFNLSCVPFFWLPFKFNRRGRQDCLVFLYQQEVSKIHENKTEFNLCCDTAFPSFKACKPTPS